jgi:hypothetical protein
MKAMPEQYVVDIKGNKTAVILSLNRNVIRNRLSQRG